MTPLRLPLHRLRIEIPLVALACVAIGVAYIHSASFDPDKDVYRPFATRQVQYVAAALLAFLATVAVPRSFIVRHAWLLYAGALLALAGVHLVGGSATNGARSWYEIRSFKVQPSEFAKLAIICAVARTLMYRRDLATIRPFVSVAGVAGPPILLILLEPDLGTVLVFSPAILAMLFVAGASLRHFAALGGAAASAFAYAYAFRFDDYQRKRILVFLGLETDKLRAGYQTLQSRIAVGSGGLFGTGWGEGPQTQLHALPEAHTDFIFSVVAEEGGFVMAALLLASLLALLMLCLDVAWRTREPFGRLVATGVAASFAAQIFVNCGMTIGLTPVTGVTLPFVSYGGSSLVASFMAIGLVANIAMRPVATLAADFGEG